VDILQRIKRLVLHDRIIFTAKARLEMEIAGLTDDDVVEAIMNSSRIDKVLRSTSPRRGHPREKLYVIKGLTYTGIFVYTKGAIRDSIDGELLYILISSKRAE
jgi:hypothetical protein